MPLDSKILCLGALEAGYNTGYDIHKAFEDGLFQNLQRLGYGSIYPALTALLADGLVTCDETSGGAGGRDRKVYTITDSGREVLRTALLGPLAEDSLRSDRMFALAFLDVLPPERAACLLEEYATAKRAREQALSRLLTAGVSRAGHALLLQLGVEACQVWVRCLDAAREGLSGPDSDSAGRVPPEVCGASRSASPRSASPRLAPPHGMSPKVWSEPSSATPSTASPDTPSKDISGPQ